jgi:presenilin-like A22 family membrane protease
LAGNSKTSKRVNFEPALWSSLLLILGVVFLFYYLSPRVNEFIESNQIAIPEASIVPILIYFFGVVIVLGLVLFFIPVSKLKLVLRMLFALLYAWGIFIIMYLCLHASIALPVAAGVSAVVGLLWFFLPLIWLQNLILLLTLVSVGAVFGSMIAPWTVVWILIAISVYDIVAVSIGYMMWLAKKLSESDTLPAFIFPKKIGDWKLNLSGSTVRKIFEEENAEKDFSLLGGGDIGFPLVFVASVFTAYGASSALIVAIASLVGLIFAYVLQIFLLKGKPLPALPPICFVAILGFLFVHFTR